MKQLSILCVLFFMLGIHSTIQAQADQPSLKIVNLNEADGLLAKPPQVVLSPKDTLQFVATNGEFAIFIENAVEFLMIDEADLHIHLDSSTQPQSDIFIVREVDRDVKTTYSIYCISDDSWPLAPPRIIITVN